MPDQPLQFPVEGRSDNDAFTDQPQLTTRDAKNVRVKDPITGRMRGAQRSGMTEVIAPSSTKIREMCSLSFVENEGVAYARRASGSVSDSWTSEVGKDATGLDVDRQGNPYFLFSPNVLRKYNPTGTLLTEFSVPTPDTSDVCRALFVDPELDCIFVGISEGPEREDATFQMLISDEDSNLTQTWSVAPGYFVEKLRVQRDKLYVLGNDPSLAKTVVLVYEGLTANATPVLVQTVRAPYPGHDLDINEDGEIFVASGPDTTHNLLSVVPTFGTQYLKFRDVPPAAPELRPEMVDWTPDDLEDAENRIWFWWRARDVTAADTVGAVDVEDGVEIETLRDRSGNGRNATRITDTSPYTNGADYVISGGRPALRFVGVNGYLSGANTTRRNTAGRTQKAILPAYQSNDDPSNTGGIFALFMTFKANVSDTIGGLIGQNNVLSTNTHNLFVNRACGAGSTVSAGVLSYFPSLASGEGDCSGGDYLQEVDFDADSEDTGVTLVSLIWDGGVNPDDDVASGTIPAASGGDSTTLIDSGASFTSFNFAAGDLCLNTADNSVARVVTVDSDTQITTTTLSGGGSNDWADTDTYRIINLRYTRCLLRVNGKPIDRGEGTGFHTVLGEIGGVSKSAATFLGGSAGTDAFVGELYEVLVLDRRVPSDSEAGDADNGNQLLIEHEKFPDVAQAAQSDNEMTRIEGYMLHGIGCGHLLPTSTDAWAHPYGLKTSGSYGANSIMGPPPSGITSAEALAALNQPCITKISSSGEKQWVYNFETATESTTADYGGAGYAVRVKDDGVYSSGPQADTINTPPADHRAHARKIIDEGSSFSDDTGDGAWVRRNGALTDLTNMYQYPYVDLDKFKTFYVPWDNGGTNSFYDLLADADGDLLITNGLAVGVKPYALHHDPRVPDYGDDTVEVARFMYAGYGEGTSTTEARRLELVDTTITETAQSRVVHLYVQGQDLKTFTLMGSTSTVDTGIFNAAGTMFCIPARNEVVLLDGNTYQVYDGPDGTVSTLESTSAGDIPLGARFGVFWRSRLLLAGFPDVGAKLVGSAIGDIRNWDVFPPREELGSAFILSISEVDEAPPDVITGLIDARDDLLIIGGRRSMTRLTGDPRAGGQLHSLSTRIGMAWGQAWTKDPEDNIYFFGTNPPGLYTVTEGGQIIPLTSDTLEDTEFAAIDFSSVYMRLYWNPADDGIHIFQFPLGPGGSARRAWFWEKKTHKMARRPPIWPDTFASTDVQPTSAIVLDGLTQAERRLVLGCEDGGIRVWDKDAKNDDGNIIDSEVMFPPVHRQSTPASLGLRGLKIFLGVDRDGCLVQYYGSNEADRVGREVQEFDIKAGENPTLRRRVRGSNIFVRFKNARLNESWAFESAHLKLVRPQKQRRSR